MNDKTLWEDIDRLVAEEHELRTQHQHGPLDEPDARRLRELKKSQDQCWDLVRQRRARREFGLDPDRVEGRTPRDRRALPAIAKVAAAGAGGQPA